MLLTLCDILKQETGAMDLDISPWSDGSSFASVVKGKAHGHASLSFRSSRYGPSRCARQCHLRQCVPRTMPHATFLGLQRWFMRRQECRVPGTSWCCRIRHRRLLISSFLSGASGKCHNVAGCALRCLVKALWSSTGTEEPCLT